MQSSRVSLIIKDNNNILLIHRVKMDRDYYVLPGGSVEEGENIVDAAIREAKEETGLDVIVDQELWRWHDDLDQRDHYCHLVTRFAGKLCLGGPEKNKHSTANKYFLEWHSLNQLDELNFYPTEIKDKLKSLI